MAGEPGLTREQSIVSAAPQPMLIRMLLGWLAVCHVAILDRRRVVLYVVASTIEVCAETLLLFCAFGTIPR